jgi:branched-chain amino acid transport system permease protein
LAVGSSEFLEDLMSLLIIAISVSMVMFLLASGLTLIFGVFGVVNFSHGVLYMLGAFIGYQTFQWTGNFWLALVLAPIVVALIGAGIEIFLLRPVYKLEHSYLLMIQIGVIFVMVDLVKSIWGAEFLMFPKPAYLSQAIQFFGSEVDPYRLFIIGLSLLIAISLFWILEKTDWGVAVRSASSNGLMAECLGIDVSFVRTMVFAVAAGLAALGGVSIAAIYPIDVLMGDAILIDCFIVVVIGGLGNIHGAVLGALMIGFLRAYGLYFISDWVNILTYSVFLIILLLLPEGLFSRKRRWA